MRSSSLFSVICCVIIAPIYRPILVCTFMLKITILQVAKTKSPELQALIREYHKRLGGSAILEEITVKKESELWEKAPESAYTILLDNTGKPFDSQQLAQFIEERKNQGDSHLIFFIGPADGFTDIQIKPNLKLSLSAMTFSHQTVRLLLAEQLYRAFCVLEGKPFSKH